MEDERWNLANPFLVVVQTDATFGKSCIHDDAPEIKVHEVLQKSQSSERSNRLMYRFADPILNDVKATADERNSAPPGMQKNSVNNGIDYLSTGKGFFRQQYQQQHDMVNLPFLTG